VTPERWQRIEQVFQEAYEHPVPDRAAFLARACGGDLALRRAVEQLLAGAAASANAFPNEPAVAIPMHSETVAFEADPSSGQSSWLVGRQLGIYRVGERPGALAIVIS
jgi:hypothetical protein